MSSASTASPSDSTDRGARLQVQSITKRFPGVLALDNVSLQVMPGETLGLIGENGAGKSTLMKILAGIQGPDSGTLVVDGQEVRFSNPNAAMSAGIALIHQELNLHEHLSVAENVFLGREPSRFGFVDRRQMAEQASKHLTRVGLDIAAQTELGTLPTAARQLVEVAKALSTNASVIIMDEPTSSLSTREAEQLFEVVDSLKQDNVSVVYISHRLGEIVRLCQRVEVLRDGCNAGQLLGDQINHDAMVSAMVGRDVDRLYQREPQQVGDLRLSVSDLRIEHDSAPIDLELRAGEVVGIAGLVGSGRSELLESIFGIRHPATGTIKVNGQALPIGRCRAAISAGLGLVPEDRKQTGLLIESTVRENATVAAMSDANAAPWLDPKWQRETTAEMIESLTVKTASQQTTIANLSGGNQQKIALGKWLVRKPTVLMLDEPTRGVDVGAKQEIYNLLDRLSSEGLAILFVSSEMEEVLALADRVLVMHDNRISGELSADELNEEAIMRLAVGMESSTDA